MVKSREAAMTERDSAAIETPSRQLRSKANQVQRAAAAVALAIDDPSGTDRLIVLSECIEDAMGARRFSAASIEGRGGFSPGRLPP
jgi:hypothetical protein